MGGGERSDDDDEDEDGAQASAISISDATSPILTEWPGGWRTFAGSRSRC